jgi:hypothetical protein
MFDKIHNTLLSSKFHDCKKQKENKLSPLKIREKINIFKQKM